MTSISSEKTKSEIIGQIAKLLKENALDSEVYHLEDNVTTVCYKDLVYLANQIIDKEDEIQYIDSETGEIKHLSSNDESIIKHKDVEYKRIRHYIPVEIHSEIKEIIEREK